jgi:hypothetical protein
MPFYADATVAGEFELIEPDQYDAVVDRIEEFQGTKYGTSEPQLQAKIVWRIKGGEYDGKTVDRIVSPSLNEKANLYPIFKAITGTTPEPGKRYDIEAEMVGKPCRVVVEDYTNTRGSTFSRVATVLPPRKSRRVVVEEDDELNDA